MPIWFFRSLLAEVCDAVAADFRAGRPDGAVGLWPDSGRGLRELNAGYLALNIVGSLLLGILAIADQRVGFIFLEFAWAGLGSVGVARAVKARHIAS